MRCFFGLMCVLALGVMGCSGTTGVMLCEGVTCEDDGNECTGDGVCNPADGECDYAPVEDGTLCDESSECTVGQCASGACELTPVTDGTACADDAGTCQDGSCQVTCTEQGIRDAIAAGGGPYTFSCDGPQTVTTATEIIIDNDVVLDGESNLTVDGGGDHRVFLVEEGVTAALRGLTVTKGGWVEPRIADEGGGGIVNLGTLSLANCTVTQCSIPGSVNPMGGFGSGAGIASSGILNMTNCTVSENSAGDGGGGIFNGGTATIANSTVSGNMPDGIFNIHEGTMEIINSTVAANGDVAIYKVGGPGTVTLAGSLIDGVCDVTDPDIAITSNGYNIESPGDTCGFDPDGTDLVNVSAEELNLGPLADNGGPTQTHALEAGSVAIDNVPEGACVDADGARLTGDQRGVPRPQGPACDSGAFELEEASVTVTGTVTFAGSGAPAEAARVSVFGAIVSTVTDAQGRFTLDVPVGRVFFQISKEGTWGQIELETVLSTRDVRFELVEDSLVEEVEQSLMIEFPETQGVVDVIFNSPSGLGGETAMLSVPSDSSLTFDAAEQPVLSEDLVAGGGEDLVFVGVDLTEELVVSPMGVAGVNTCDLENAGTVFPVLAKSFTRVREVQCAALP